MVEERSSAIQRVRIGLTGLGFVFVAVLLAAAFTREPEAEAPITNATVGTAVAEPQEPLAELGVAPGNAETNSTNQVTPAR